MRQIQDAKPPTFIAETREEAERNAAHEIAVLLQAKPTLVLGLATGNSPIGVYRELIRLHREGTASFARATTFNLDEYLDLETGHPRSFRRWMSEQLFAHVDLAPHRARLPDSAPRDPHAAAARYEAEIRAAGGIDILILGIGRNGHIGFNEPGSTADSRTRVVELDAMTRLDAAAIFGGIENVPTRAITMGVATILDARLVRVLAFGLPKAEIVRMAIHGPVGASLPVTFLRGHAGARLYVDREAATRL